MLKNLPEISGKTLNNTPASWKKKQSTRKAGKGHTEQNPTPPSLSENVEEISRNFQKFPEISGKKKKHHEKKKHGRGGGRKDTGQPAPPPTHSRENHVLQVENSLNNTI